MTKSTITREQLTEWVAQLDSDGGCDATDKQLETLIRQSLAAMDSEPEYLPLDYLQGHRDGLEWSARLAESNHPQTGDWLYDDPIELAKAIRKGPDMPPAQPVAGSEPDRNPVLAYADSYRDMAKQGIESVPIWSVITDLERNIAPLYRHAQPALERDQVRSEHAEWSQATFGDVGPVGPLKHLSKEALEAAAEPDDLSEWADMQFLLWDAQRRAGITDEHITQAMIEKLAVNKQREWPEPKDGEPRLHIKEQPAPVVPDGWVMVPKEPTDEMISSGIAAHYDRSQIQIHDRPAPGPMECAYVAMLAAADCSIPMISDRWVPVSERVPENDGAYLCWDKRYVTTYAFIFGAWQANQFIAKNITHWMPLPAAPQEVKGE